jgi:uncharacterized protein (DUF58 family)
MKARHHMASVLAFLRVLRCSGATRFGGALRTFALHARSPGLVILISDLLGGADAQAGIEALRHGGHDVVVIQLLAEAEIDPQLDGMLRLVDGETGEALDATVDEDVRRRYRRRLDQYLRQIEIFCRRHGLEYLRVSTAIAFEDIMLKYLRQGAHVR